MIPTALELLIAWGDSYLTHVQRTMSRQTYVEKESIAKRMIKYLLFARSHEIWQREIL